MTCLLRVTMPRKKRTPKPKPITITLDVVDNPITARTEREALERISAYIDRYTDQCFYIGITSGVAARTALKRRWDHHHVAKKEQLYEMHVLYVSASNRLIREFEEKMIEKYIVARHNVNSIKGHSHMKKESISSATNSYLYLLVP